MSSFPLCFMPLIYVSFIFQCGFFKRKKYDSSPTYNAKLEKNTYASETHATSPIYTGNAKSEKIFYPDESHSLVKK